MTDISRTELCQWLRDNSSGVYRHAADAADEIEMLAQLANQHFARAMANGEEVRRLREGNERLRKDAERGCYFIERGEWFRHDHGTPDAHALLAIRLPYTADLSCKAMREFAIDAARGAK